MDQELLESYRNAETLTRKRARNFYYAFMILPPEKRRAFCAVYAFMRQCDDISDGAGTVDEKRRMLMLWRTQLNAALDGKCRGNPILPAFRDSVERFSIPGEYFHWIIDGSEMDLAVDRYETFEDLYGYCFKVASAVGLVSIRIFGFRDERAAEHAEQCGIAFQLTNILRDVKEDASMGRVYIPMEDLRRFNYSPEELRHGILDERFRNLMTFEARRAREYYAQGRRLLPLIDTGSRPALWTMMEIYGRLLRKIVSREYDVFGEAIRLSRSEKASIALQAFAKRFIPGGNGLR